MPLDPAKAILLYVVVPLWIFAGVADWLCHRASDIEHTSGAKESLLHLLQFGQVGAGLLAALFLELNALVIAALIVLFALHEATAIWDVRYAVSARVVAPAEQHVHSVLEMLPLTAILMICTLHWPQALALFGWGDEPARFTLAWKHDALPPAYLAIVLTAAFVLGFLPYVEELIRCRRAASHTPNRT
jgi:hypothetical protein